MWISDLAIALLSIAVLPRAISTTRPHTNALFPNNENHIFNAIHAALKQWDSSYHHNGMSFFLSYVPVDTALYHSEFKNESITGLKWLGFEPELPLDCLRGTLVPGGPPPDVRPPDWDDETVYAVGSVADHEQISIGAEKHSQRMPYLHTYRTSRDLRLLYIDGQSASKTLNGTLDSTDRILLDDLLTGHPINNDRKRGSALCGLWPDRIDGFIRMQEGFEVILCSAETSVALQSIIQTDGYAQLKHGGEALWQSILSDSDLSVGIDVDSMVTAYSSKYDIDLYANSSKGLPRLNRMTPAQRTSIKLDLDEIISRHDVRIRKKWTWQTIARNIVSRYTVELKSLVETSWASKDHFDTELSNFLRRHVDISQDDREADISRCQKEYLPSSYAHSEASAAIESISAAICHELFMTLNLSLPQATNRLKHLMQGLGWSAFKYCSGCRGKEVCFIPQWFLGGQEDRDNPRCRNFSDFRTRTGYWGDLGRVREPSKLG